MDEAKLAEIEARANAATPGPWVRAYATATRDIESTCGVTGVDLDGVTPWFEPDLCVEVQGGEEHHAADIDFIVHARTDVPALVAEVRRLTAALAAARREGAEEMREALIVRFTQRVEYLHPWAEAEDDENGCHSGAWTEALNAVQFTRDMVLPLDAPGGAT